MSSSRQSKASRMSAAKATKSTTTRVISANPCALKIAGKMLIAARRRGAFAIVDIKEMLMEFANQFVGLTVFTAFVLLMTRANVTMVLNWRMKIIAKSTLSGNNSAMKYAPTESASTTIANASPDIKVCMECFAVALQRWAD